jgi:hypothetical protein
VRYDDQRATLVTSPERDDEVTATVYSCTGARLDRITVASR